MKILVLGCGHLGATLASTIARSASHDDSIIFVEVEKEQPSFEEIVFHDLAKDTLELIPFIKPVLTEDYPEYFAPMTFKYSLQTIRNHISAAISKSLHLISRSRPPPEHYTIIKNKTRCMCSGFFCM